MFLFNEFPMLVFSDKHGATSPVTNPVLLKASKQQIKVIV